MDDSQFREIFEKSPIGTIFHEKKGILTDINQSALDILGIPSLNAVKDVNLFDNPEITSRKKELLNKGIINFQAPLDFDNIKNIGLYDPTKSGIGFIDYIVSTTDSGFIVQIQDITEHKKADEALKESEDKFSKAWHSNSAAMTITRLSDGMIIDANESFEQLFGYTNEETVGHSTNELGIWLNSQERDNEVEKLLKLGKLPIHEVTFGTKSGKHINVLFSVELISIGGQLHILSTIMDITERKNAEEQIELERKRLETILETSPSAVIIVEAADGNVSYINNRARQLYGIDISGLNLADAIGRVKSRRIDGSEYLVGEGPSSRALKGKVVRNEEMIMEQADGTVIPILGSAAPIFDSEGKVIAAAAIFDDITDRKKAEKYIKNLLEESQQLNEELEVSNEELQASTEELQTANEELRHQSDELLLTNQALQESEEKYRNIIDNVQDAYFRADKEGKIIMASPSAARMYDFDSPEEMMGLPALSVYKNEEDRDFVLKELNKYGKLNNNEVEAVRKDGTIFWASQNAQYYHDKEGQIQGTESFVRDITEHKRAGKLLQTTLQRFYSILSGMYGAILLVSDKDRVEFANQAFCDFFNLDESPEDLVGLNSGEMIEKIKNGYVHPNEAVIRINEIVDRGQPVKGEEVDLKNGRTCIRDFIPLYIDEKSYGRLWHHMDITERKQVEEEIQRNLKLLDGVNRVFEESLTCETIEEVVGKCLEVAEELTGSKFSFIGEVNENGRLDDRALSPPGWEACTANPEKSLELLSNMEIVSYWGRTIKEEKSQIVNNPDSDPDKRGVPKGHPPITSFLGVPLKQGGKTFGMIALANKKDGYDLEDKDNIETLSVVFVEALMRKKAEIQLKESHANLEQKVEERTMEIEEAYQLMKESELKAKERADLLDITHEAIFIRDMDDKIVFWNNGAEELYGWSKKEALGKEVHELLETEFPEPLDQIKIDVLSKEGWDGELTHTKRNGTKINVLSRWSLQRDRKYKPMGFLEVNVDITDRKKAEEQLKESINELERSNMELQSFAYITSHDLQEPLRSIASYAQLIKRRYQGQLDSDADDFIDFMVAGATRMKEQIQGLLEYSRVGTQGEEFNEFNATDALNIALSNLKSSIDEFDADVNPDPLPDIVADESQITRVFQNLIGNALKFRREGVKPEIHISAQKEDDKYVFSVQDNGIGIEEEYSDRIFEVFKRLHAIGEYRGAGIGLAIVKRIIERHGGQIWVDSEFGKGTIFYFTIPVR